MPDLEATRRATCATHFQRSTRFKTGRLEHPSLPSNCVTGTSREDFEDLKARSSSQRCEGLCLGVHHAAPLKFICPATHNEVDTGVDLDDDIFARLLDDTELNCPH